MIRIVGLAYTDRFARDFKKLDPQTQLAVRECMADLLKYPIPKTRRVHALTGVQPKIFKADVSSNHAYQVTFELIDSAAKLLRVGTHKQLDSSPRGNPPRLLCATSDFTTFQMP